MATTAPTLIQRNFGWLARSGWRSRAAATMSATISRITGHLAMSQTVTAGRRARSRRRSPGATGPVTTRPISTSAARTTAAPAVKTIINGPQLPDRPALLDLVDPVHRPPEGADIARRRPQRAGQTDDQAEPGRGARSAASVVGLTLSATRPGAEVLRMSSRCSSCPRPGRTGRAARPARAAAGNNRQHRVVGQRGGQVGALVVGELAEGATQDELPGAGGELVGRVGRRVRVLGRWREPFLRRTAAAGEAPGTPPRPAAAPPRSRLGARKSLRRPASTAP